MQNFTLELQFKINGLGSASGLVYKNNSLFDKLSILLGLDKAAGEGVGT